MTTTVKRKASLKDRLVNYPGQELNLKLRI